LASPKRNYEKEEKVKNIGRVFPIIVICCVVTSSICFTAITAEAADKDPKPKNDEHCWDISNPECQSESCVRLILYVMKIGDGHHLCTGVFIVTEGIDYQGSVFGNAEYLAGEFHMTLSLAGIRNGVIGIDMMKARLDPDTLDGTFEYIGVYADAVEISSGTLVYTSCE